MDHGLRGAFGSVRRAYVQYMIQGEVRVEREKMKERERERDRHRVGDANLPSSSEKRNRKSGITRYIRPRPVLHEWEVSEVTGFEGKGHLPSSRSLTSLAVRSPSARRSLSIFLDRSAASFSPVVLTAQPIPRPRRWRILSARRDDDNDDDDGVDSEIVASRQPIRHSHRSTSTMHQVFHTTAQLKEPPSLPPPPPTPLDTCCTDDVVWEPPARGRARIHVRENARRSTLIQYTYTWQARVRALDRARSCADAFSRRRIPGASTFTKEERRSLKRDVENARMTRTREPGVQSKPG